MIELYNVEFYSFFIKKKSINNDIEESFLFSFLGSNLNALKLSKKSKTRVKKMLIKT